MMPTNWRTGRKVHMPCSDGEIMRLEGIGLRRAKIAELLGISESSVYRIVIRERLKAGLAPPARPKADRPRAVERL
jgi:transposase